MSTGRGKGPSQALLADRQGGAACFTADGRLWLACSAGIRDHRDGRRPDGRLGNRGFSINYLLRGRGTYRDQHGRSHALGPGSAFQRIGDLDHETLFDRNEPCSEAYLSLGVRLAAPLRQIGLLRDDPAVLQPGWDPELPRRFAALCDALTRRDEPRRILLGALDLVRELYDRHDRGVGDVDAVEALRRLLAERAAAPFAAIPTQEVGDVSADALRRAFRKRFGQSPAAYHQGERMRLACRLLDDLPVAAVAERLGYADASAFSKQFRQAMGVPPTTWPEVSAAATPARRRGGPTSS